MTVQERITRLVLVGGVFVWIVNGAIRWWLGAPLGHDEARYALDARAFVDGAPTPFLYSGAGMQLVGAPGILLGESERALRLVPLLLGTGFLAALYLLARRVGGATTAAWTVAIVAGSRTLAIHGHELLSDLPSAACLVLVLVMLVRELPREDGPRWRIVAIAPLAAAAFYLRYGSVVAMTAIAIGFVLTPSLPVARRPGRLLATAALFALLLVPHAWHALETTGSIGGILRASSEIPPPSTGLTEYMRDPFTKYGALVVPLMVIALGAAPRSRLVVALQLAAVAQFSLMTLISHAQPRFVYLATALLCLIGVDALVRLVERVQPRVRTVATVLALGAVVTTWAMAFVRIPHHVRSREAARCLSNTRVEWYRDCR